MKENLLNLGGYIDVLLSRDKETDDTLHETNVNKQKYRCDPANAAKADYFVSLHSNGYHASTRNGFAIYREDARSEYKKESANSKELAEDIMSQYPVQFPNGITIQYKVNNDDDGTDFTYAKSITIKKENPKVQNLYVLSYDNLKVPHRILVEIASHSHPEEVLVLASKEGQETLAQKLTDGLLINIKKHFTIK